MENILLLNGIWNNMLKEYLRKRRIKQQDFANALGIHLQSLRWIIEKKSPKTGVLLCLKIKRLTGLEPEQYLTGLEEYKKLKKMKSNKRLYARSKKL